MRCNFLDEWHPTHHIGIGREIDVPNPNLAIAFWAILLMISFDNIIFYNLYLNI